MDSQAAAAGSPAARLLRLRLATRQAAVLFFLLVTAIGCAGLSFFPLNSSAYFWAYLLSQGVSDVVAIAVVRELFSTIVAGYPGIQTAARWVLNGAIAVSVTASLIIIIPMWGAAPDSSHLFYVLELHRSIVFSLAVII